MVLNLKIEMLPVKNIEELLAEVIRAVHITIRQRTRDRARQTGRQTDESLAVRAQQLHVDTRLHVKALRETARHHVDEVAVAGHVLAQQDEVRVPLAVDVAAVTEAFDLAEKYRHPVLIASDAAIGQMIEAVEIPEFVEHDINKFDWSIKGCKKGCEQRKIQNVYYTHPDYEGYLSSKYAQMEEEEQRYENIQVEDAEVVLVAYGISSRVSREAVEIARAQGFKLGLIRPITLWPFPKKAFEEAKEAKAFLTVEMNILGQMVDDVKLATEGKYPVEHYGSIFEIPETDGIIAKAKEMLKKGEI